MDKLKNDPLYTGEAKQFINEFLNFKKGRLKDKNVVEKYMEYIKMEPKAAGAQLNLLSELTQRFIQPVDYVKFLNEMLDNNPFYYKKGNEYMLVDDFEDYRLQHLEQYNPDLVEKYSQQLYPELETERAKIKKRYNTLKKYKEYRKMGGSGDIIKEIEDLRKEITEFNNRTLERFKFPECYFKNLDYYKENYIIPKTQKPILRVSQPDNYFSSFNPTYNHTLSKTYNTVSIEPLHEDNNTLSKANKKLTEDYNTLSIAKKQLEEDNKKIKEDNKEMERLNRTLKNELDQLDKEFNDNVKIIMDDKNKQIEELKKKNKLAIGKETEFEVNNKNLSDVDIQTTSPKQINKDIQTNLPSLYITDFRETYNQQGDYNKRVEAIQENAKRKVENIKKIYNQAKEDLIDEYNNLANQLKEEYKNKKIRQNEYFEIPSKEQPEDNNTTNKLVLTNNKDMTDINQQMKSPTIKPLNQKITPPQETNTPQPPEATGKEEEDKPEKEDKPEEEDKEDDFNELDISSTTETEDEEDKEEKKVIPIEKVSEELSKVIDSFYIQDKPIEETFGKLEKTINNIPDEVFYQIEPYIASALANITVDGQKVFNDEAEVQQLLLKIKNPNKINKRYKLPKKLDKAITQSHQRHLTISPMLLRNRKQTNINKNIYQY